MKTTITLKERVPDIVYSIIREDIQKRSCGEQIFQKYFYSKAPPTKPVLRISYDESYEHEFVLRPTVFKSGREGYSGISFWNGLIVRANISCNADTNPDFYLLTVVLDSDNNNYNHNEREEYDEHKK